MREEPAKCFGADFAFADVLVAVYATAERNFGVVDVEDGNALKTDDAVDEFERGGEASFTFYVVARGEKMRGVETAADIQASQGVQHVAEFLEASAKGGAHARGVFQQDAQRTGRQILCGLLDGFDGEARGLIGSAIAARAGMHDDEIGAECDTA